MISIRISLRQKALVGVAVGGVLLVLAGVVRVPARTVLQDASTGNVGEIRGPVEVGQTFVSDRPRLSGVAVRIATYGDRPAHGDVIFELRRAPRDNSALRAARVPAGAFRDHALYTFRFAPVRDSTGKSFTATLRSPNSRRGDAVTVDYSNQDPYRRDGTSAMILFRSGRESADAADRAIKPQSDLSFALVHRVSVWEWGRLRFLPLLTELVRDRKRLVVLGSMAAAALAVAFATFGRPWPSRVPRHLWIWLVSALVIGGLFLRLLYAMRMPVTNDEGTLLYDAWTLRQARLPGGDGVLKAPTVLGVLAGTFATFGRPTLLSARLVSIGAGLLTVLPLLAVARAPAPTARHRLRVAALWCLAAAPAVFSIYLHAQPLQMLLVSVGLALLVRSLGQAKHPLLQALLSGMVFALAFGARKSSAAAILPALLALLALGTSWRGRFRTLVASACGFIVSFGGLIAVEWTLYGAPGVQYFLGLDVARIDPDTTASAEERRQAFIAGALPLFRGALPLLLLALIGLGAVGEELLRRLGRFGLLPRLAWLVPLGIAWYGGRFLLDHEQTERLAFGIWPFWITLGVTLGILTLLPRRSDDADRNGRFPLRHLLSGPVLAIAWLAGAALIYASWIKFTANYLAEFLPPLVLLAAWGGAWLTSRFAGRRVILAVLGLLVAWGAYASARSSYVFEHTGTFDRSSLEEAARVLSASVPKDEPILTAAVAIPVLSGHRVLNDVAHPTHYAYGFIEPRVRNIYMTPREDMVRAALSDVRWVVLERLTAFSYFREYPEIETHVRENFDVVAELENLSNPLKILRRK